MAKSLTTTSIFSLDSCSSIIFPWIDCFSSSKIQFLLISLIFSPTFISLVCSSQISLFEASSCKCATSWLQKSIDTDLYPPSVEIKHTFMVVSENLYLPVLPSSCPFDCPLLRGSKVTFILSGLFPVTSQKKLTYLPGSASILRQRGLLDTGRNMEKETGSRNANIPRIMIDLFILLMIISRGSAAASSSQFQKGQIDKLQCEQLKLQQGHMEEAPLEIPNTYFDLIKKVGSKGQYQTVVFFIFCLNWFTAGFLLLGTSFLFMNPTFDCEGTPSEIKQCQKDYCSQDQSQWQNHLNPPYVQSLATQFGPYLCSQEEELNGLRMILYVGTFCGYMVFLFITDNYGRKTSVVVAWAVTTFGVLLLVAAQDMGMACVGLFLAGAGCQSSIRISMAIFSQIVDYYKRQSYSVALEIAFGMSGVAVGVVYWIFKAWRISNILFCAIPCIIELLLLIFYLQQTPKFLVTKKGIDKTIKALNRIGEINLKKKDIVRREDVENVLLHEEGGNSDKFNFIITPYHLFKFKSLRGATVTCSLMFLLITYVYFGPIVIVDKLGITPFLSQIIISCSQLFAYPFAYCFIKKLSRIKTGYISFAIAAGINFILIFVHPGEECENCTEGIIEIIGVFLSRFVISFYFAIFFLYVTEVFPLRARGLGFGMASACGAIASSSGQFIFAQLQQKMINPMIFFTGFNLLAIVVLCFMRQTFNKPLEQEIREIQIMKDKDRLDQDRGDQRKTEKQDLSIEMQEQQDGKNEQKFSALHEEEN